MGRTSLMRAMVAGVGEQPISWSEHGLQGEPGPPGPVGPMGPAGDGAKTVAGIVSADGSVIVGQGFTVTRVAAGRYNLNFPAGSWQTFPVATASPFGAFGSFGQVTIASAIGFGDGSATVQVVVTSDDAVLYDNAFNFVAVAS